MQYDLIIIGGGPAGINAGIYASRKKLKTLLITKEFLGQVGLSWRIENYLGFPKITGRELLKCFKNHLKQNKIEVKNYEEVIEIKEQEKSFQVYTKENKFNCSTIIIASGALPKKLNIQNEEKFIGKGISYCLTCDAKAFENKKVVVIGGGNTGAESAIELLKFASEIYLLEYMADLTCDEILKEEIKENSKIKVITNAQALSFEGETDLKKIIYQDKKTKEEKELLADGCFIEIGSKPNTDFVKDLLDLNNLGEIIINPKTMETSKKGIFAAGDNIDFVPKQIILAASQGALAALSAYAYLRGYQK